jgi:hypothetical protein
MEIYVVMSQGNFINGTKGYPTAVYPDYPSALAYAKTIFNSRGLPGVNENPRDLVYLLTMSTSTSTTPASTSAVVK